MRAAQRRAARAAASAEQVACRRSATAPAVGSIRRSSSRAERRLAAARFADQPERLAARERRSDTPSTALHDAPRLRPRRKRLTAHREQCFDAVERPASRRRAMRGRSCARSRRDAAPAAPCQQRERVPAPPIVASSGGASRAQRSSAKRAARREAAAAAAASVAIGTMPAIAAQARRAPRCRARDRRRAGRACTDAAASRRAPRPRACSTIWPAYITGDASAISATTPRSCVISMIAMPVSRCSSRSRSRICAWIVTSSAVVGSSAISSAGLAGQRHRDHHALAHAARELVRILVDALARAPGCRPARSISIARARAVARVERRDADAATSPIWSPTVNTGFSDGHRLLEDHRDPVAAQLAHARRRRGSSRSRPSKLDRAAGDCAGRPAASGA